MMDMTNFNDGRIEVTKVPKGKSGGKVTIRMKIVNDEDSDMEDTTITLVGGTRYDDILNNVFEQDEDCLLYTSGFLSIWWRRLTG